MGCNQLWSAHGNELHSSALRSAPDQIVANNCYQHQAPVYDMFQKIDITSAEQGVTLERSVGTLAKQGRAILTGEQARLIFQGKPSPSDSKGRGKAKELARTFRVSVKTVRDIWVGRTWYRATLGLDKTKPIMIDRLDKKPGRPKGAKDSKPRIKRMVKYESYIESTESAAQDQMREYFPAKDYGARISASDAIYHEPSCAAAGSSIKRQPAIQAASQLESSFQQTNGHGWNKTSSNPQSEPHAFAPEFHDPFHHDWAFWPHPQARSPGGRAAAGRPPQALGPTADSFIWNTQRV